MQHSSEDDTIFAMKDRAESQQTEAIEVLFALKVMLTFLCCALERQGGKCLACLTCQFTAKSGSCIIITPMLTGKVP